MYTAKDSIMNEKELQQRVYKGTINSKGEKIYEPYEELAKIYGLERKLKRFLTLKDYVNIFISDIQYLYETDRISREDFKSIENILSRLLSDKSDNYIVQLYDLNSAINNFIVNIKLACEKGHIKNDDIININDLLITTINEKFPEYSNDNTQEEFLANQDQSLKVEKPCANKSKINNQELIIDNLKNIDNNSNKNDPLVNFTKVNENGEVVNITPLNNPTSAPVTGVTVGLNGEVKTPINNADIIIKKGINKIKNKINILPVELKALSDALATQSIEIRKGKNSNKINGVYEIFLFKNNLKIAKDIYIYIDSVGVLSNAKEPRLYISKSQNQINIDNSALLSDIKNCIDIIFQYDILNNLQNLNNIVTTNSNIDTLDINRFVDFYANYTLPSVINGQLQPNQIDRIINNKFASYIIQSIKTTNGNCRFRIRDFINLDNFKLVSDSTVPNEDGSFVQRPVIILELKNNIMYTNLK